MTRLVHHSTVLQSYYSFSPRLSCILRYIIPPPAWSHAPLPLIVYRFVCRTIMVDAIRALARFLTIAACNYLHFFLRCVRRFASGAKASIITDTRIVLPTRSIRPGVRYVALTQPDNSRIVAVRHHKYTVAVLCLSWIPCYTWAAAWRTSRRLLYNRSVIIAVSYVTDGRLAPPVRVRPQSVGFATVAQPPRRNGEL